MRFTYAETMVDPTYYVPLARAAEEAGYTTMVVADSVAYPKDSDAKYPYTPDGSREFLENKPFVEAFVGCAPQAAVTTTRRVTPGVGCLAHPAPPRGAQHAPPHPPPTA
ncbi:LLM class F420-dependent oxidoreductase, partial [Nocardia sp. NPDC057440]